MNQKYKKSQFGWLESKVKKLIEDWRKEQLTETEQSFMFDVLLYISQSTNKHVDFTKGYTKNNIIENLEKLQRTYKEKRIKELEKELEKIKGVD